MIKYTQTAPPSEGTSFRPSERAEYNEVYVKGQKILRASTAAAPVNAIISLNRYGFFDTFAGEMSPNGKFSIDIH